MNADTYAKAQDFNPSYTVRAAAGLGLVLILTFAGSARAQDWVSGLAVAIDEMFEETCHNIALDALGNLYTTGSFVGTADFDPDAGRAYPSLRAIFLLQST